MAVARFSDEKKLNTNNDLAFAVGNALQALVDEKKPGCFLKFEVCPVILSGPNAFQAQGLEIKEIDTGPYTMGQSIPVLYDIPATLKVSNRDYLIRVVAVEDRTGAKKNEIKNFLNKLGEDKELAAKGNASGTYYFFLKPSDLIKLLDIQQRMDNIRAFSYLQLLTSNLPVLKDVHWVDGQEALTFRMADEKNPLAATLTELQIPFQQTSGESPAAAGRGIQVNLTLRREDLEKKLELDQRNTLFTFFECYLEVAKQYAESGKAFPEKRAFEFNPSLIFGGGYRYFFYEHGRNGFPAVLYQPLHDSADRDDPFLDLLTECGFIFRHTEPEPGPPMEFPFKVCYIPDLAALAKTTLANLGQPGPAKEEYDIRDFIKHQLFKSGDTLPNICMRLKDTLPPNVIEFLETRLTPNGHLSLKFQDLAVIHHLMQYPAARIDAKKP